MSITWSAWHVDVFERARAEHKPVLLSISAAWCRWCREMDRTSYADPAVVRLVNDRFVAVRVDADRRPDISDRYSLGGLPTTAFLTPDGEVVGGGTYVPPERMPGVLERVLEAFATRRDEIARRARTAAPSTHAAGAESAPSVDALVASVFQSYDPRYGGFGTAPKFPLTAPLHLALELHRSSGDAGMCAIAECSLDAMITRGLYDAVDGGFFRYATMRDWQQPHREKLLDVNAAMLRLLLDAEAALNAARYRDVARGVVRYVQTWMADIAEGGWAGSQAASQSYYDRPTQEARRALEAPAVDRTIYTGWNAAMISAALHAAAETQDSDLGEFAICSLERVLLACYQPGAGVAHYFDGQPHVRGLLDDQVAMANAALDAAEATGRVPYEMLAEELALFALRTMWDEYEGGFLDRAAAPGEESVGRLRERVKPFVSNCEAARMLARLAASSGDHDFAARAREALEAMAPFAAREGPLAAHYLLAMRETTHGFR